MPWPTDYANGADASAYAHHLALWRAVDERTKAIGSPRWPRHNMVFDEGVVGALDDIGDGTYTLTDATKNWIIVDADHPAPGSPRWAGWTDPDDDKVPSDYDVIVNGDDPDITRHVHLQITGNTATQLAVTTPADWIVGGWIPSAAWLVGKPYHIIKRGGYWWGERWPVPPNDHELYVGFGEARTLVRVPGAAFAGLAGKTFTAGAIVTPVESHTADTLVIARQSTAPAGDFTVTDGATTLASGTIGSVLDGALTTYLTKPLAVDPAIANGADLMIYAGARVQRVPLGPQAVPGVLEFARRATAVHGPFSLQVAGGRAWPGRKGSPIHQWYDGVPLNHYTHLPGDLIYQDALYATPMPATSIQLDTGEDPAFCEVASFPVFDVDYWTSTTEACGTRDQSYAPFIHRTLRQLQLTVETICREFVPEKIYAGTTAIERFRPATLFEWIGLNFVGRYTAVADTEGAYAFTFPPQVTDPYWAVLDVRGRVVGPGDGKGGASGSLSFTGGTPGETYILVVAMGWTRNVPREFRYAYQRTAFIPDIMVDEFGNSSTVDPPTRDYPGEWITRGPSTGPKRYEPFGFAVDAATPFETGRRYRYVGDNWGDPAVTPQTPVGEDGPLDAVFYRNLWEGRFPQAVRGAYEASKRGTARHGEGRWLRARAGTDWWAAPAGAGTLRVETGTATGGSATTLTIDARTFTPAATPGDPFPTPQPDPYWQVPRYVGMMLEVDATVPDALGDDRLVTYRTPVTAQTSTSLTFAAVGAFTIPEEPATNATPLVPAVAVPALAVVSGSIFRVREPAYRLNWWRGRTVTIRSAIGTSVTRTVTHHDADTLWLNSAPGFDVAGATFALEELTVGGVYERTATGWIAPTDNPRELPLPHLLAANDVDYGNVMAGDYMAGHELRELYDAINALVWTIEDAAWNGIFGCATAGNARGAVLPLCAGNVAWPNPEGSPSPPIFGDREGALAYARSVMSEAYEAGEAGVNAGPPMGYLRASTSETSGGGSVDAMSEYKRLNVATGTFAFEPVPFPFATEWLAYGTLDALDRDPVDESGGDVDTLVERRKHYFHAMGENLEFRTYTSFDSGPAGTARVSASRVFGNLDEPTSGGCSSAPDMPPPVNPAGDKLEGEASFYVGRCVLIRKWVFDHVAAG